MRKLALALVGAAAAAGAMQPSHDMHMGGPVLFLGRADGGQVVPRQTSAATATAAVIVDRGHRQIRYDITFNGLERGAPSRIGLYNFGSGGNGTTVALLCGGDGAPPCPARPSARLAGIAEPLRWSGALLQEFASGRVYLQIDAADGRPEIRGQLDANGAMVPTRIYVAQLAPSGAPGATGEGTAVLSETYLPGERVAVDYSVTVAGTSGRPEDVALIGLAPEADPRSSAFLSAGRLRNARRLFSAAARNGGTFSGSYVARRGDSSAPLADTFFATQRRPALSVRTSRFPRGELVGVFTPVE